MNRLIKSSPFLICLLVSACNFSPIKKSSENQDMLTPIDEIEGEEIDREDARALYLNIKTHTNDPKYQSYTITNKSQNIHPFEGDIVTDAYNRTWCLNDNGDRFYSSESTDGKDFYGEYFYLINDSQYGEVLCEEIIDQGDNFIYPFIKNINPSSYEQEVTRIYDNFTIGEKVALNYQDNISLFDSHNSLKISLEEQGYSYENKYYSLGEGFVCVLIERKLVDITKINEPESNYLIKDIQIIKFENYLFKSFYNCQEYNLDKKWIDEYRIEFGNSPLQLPYGWDQSIQSL